MMQAREKAVILWLPSVAFFTVVIYRVLVLYPEAELDRAYWKFPETPTFSLWIPTLLLQAYAVQQHRKRLIDIKVAMLWSLLLTTFAIQGLALLSALCSSSAPFTGKPGFYYIICDEALWEWPCMGSFQDTAYDEASRSVVDQHGAVLHRFKPTEKPVYFVWRDLAVRLGYVYLIDNIIRVVWLRYLFESAPYTTHVNNSELFTVLLGVQMAVYSYSRQCTRVKVHYNVESDSEIDEKSEVAAKIGSETV